MAVYQNQDARGPRRPAAQPMGSQPVGPQVMSAGGKALSFDYVLQKLQVSPLITALTNVQAELQRSRDESADLSGLSTQMNEIQDTLAGGMVSSLDRDHQAGLSANSRLHPKTEVLPNSSPPNTALHLPRSKPPSPDPTANKPLHT
jgi:hypothetical protein